MASQPPPTNAQPAFNPQLVSMAPPPRSSQPVRKFAPPFDPKPFSKLQRTATGHYSRLTQPLANLPAVSDGQPASNPPSDSTASQPPPADAQPDANLLLTAMASPALNIQPASNMPPSIAMAPPPRSVYLPPDRQFPVNPYPLRDPQYRLTHMTYYNPPTNRNRQPASNVPRTAVPPQPASAIDGQPAPNAPQTATAPQPPSANEHSDSKHSSRTAARTTHPSADSYSNPNAQPAPNDSSAPMTPPPQLAQPVVKPEPVSDAQQASATSSIPKAPDPEPAQSASTQALASSTPPNLTQPDEYPHPLKNAAQWYLDNPPTNTTDRIIERELRAVYDKLTYTQMNTLRTKYLATLSTLGKVTLMQCNTDPVVLYLLAELKNENLRLTTGDSDDPRSNPVHSAAERVKFRIETADAFAKQKEKGQKQKTSGGAAVSQPNAMPVGSGQQAGVLSGPQLGSATNGGGGMSSHPSNVSGGSGHYLRAASGQQLGHVSNGNSMTAAQPSNVPLGLGQYFGLASGQQLGPVSSGGGMMPAQPSNIPLSSGQYFGPASGPQPSNDMKPGDWLLAQPSNVPVSSGRNLGGVNSQQSGTAFNNVGGSSTVYYQNVQERPNYLPGPYEMNENQGARQAAPARTRQLGSSAMGFGQQFGSVPGQQQWNTMNGPPMGYPAGMEPQRGFPIMAPMQQVGAMGWPQQGRAIIEQQQGYAVAGPWPGDIAVEDRSLWPGGVGSRQNPEVIE
ncbi:hypothetical protein LTS10_012084 [Elasticomyces elasticus]|nr:hypothetical protein LTS10_012084 [Elasticomyces elasticus]